MATYSDERIREMIAGRRAPKTYELPLLDGVEASVRVLSEQEIDDARIEAQRYCVKREVNVEIDPDFLERETRRQMIWRAFRDPADTERKFFPSDGDVRGLDAELVRALFETYWEHQAHVSPLRTLDKQGVKELAEALGKAPDAAGSLRRFDYDTLLRLSLTLASTLRST